MTSPLTIIGFSGPPRAGKDESLKAASAYLTGLNLLWTVERLSAPLKEAATCLLPDKNFAREERKDLPEPTLDESFRQIQIDLYHYGAGAFGTAWLGHHMARRLESLSAYSAKASRPSPIIFCPDFGREEEVQVLISSGHKVIQFSLSRPGTTYLGDSRSFFLLPAAIEVSNLGSLQALNEIITAKMAILFPPP